MDMPRARRSDPETSHLAAARVDDLARQQAAAVLVAVKMWPDKTSLELAGNIEWAAGRGRWTGPVLDRHDIARRLPELERAGLVRRGAARKCQRSGNKALTWEPIK